MERVLFIMDYDEVMDFIYSELKSANYNKDNIHELYDVLIKDSISYAKETICSIKNYRNENINRDTKISTIALLINFVFGVFNNLYSYIYGCCVASFIIVILSYIINNILCFKRINIIKSTHVDMSFAARDMIISAAEDVFGEKYTESEYSDCAIACFNIFFNNLIDQGININKRIVKKCIREYNK